MKPRNVGVGRTGQPLGQTLNEQCGSERAKIGQFYTAFPQPGEQPRCPARRCGRPAAGLRDGTAAHRLNEDVLDYVRIPSGRCQLRDVVFVSVGFFCLGLFIFDRAQRPYEPQQVVEKLRITAGIAI